MLSERLRGGGNNETDLAELSLEAIIEVDRYLRGQSEELGAVRRLKEQLVDVATPRSGQDVLNLQGNPRTIGIFGKALHDTCARQVATIDDLTDAVHSLFNVVDRADGVYDRDSLGTIRKFCISLHEGLISSYPPASDYEDVRYVYFASRP